MSESAISVSNIGKRYKLGEDASLFDRIAWLRRMRGKAPLAPPASFWALDDVSFEIKQGEAVGIIGHNGAGKSTLLKVLSRITEPTRGQAEITGRVASLLEVGTGFHPELTGRENIYMNGSILGMRRGEIARAFDEIVAFAGVEQFVDTPVKRYSSGMYVRLAFSVAAHLEPEILIVDEVLAVGDVQFQKKCLGKMGDVSRSGRTVLFVSHNMTAVRQLTSRCILLKKGKVFFDGSPTDAIDTYFDVLGEHFTQGIDLADWPRPKLNLDGDVTFKRLRFARDISLFHPGEDLVMEVTAIANAGVPALRVSGTVSDGEGQPVGHFFTRDACPMNAGEERTFQVTFRNFFLAPGRYSFGLGLVEGTEITGYRDYDVVNEVLPFEVGAIRGDDGTLGVWYPSWGPVRMPAPEMMPIHASLPMDKGAGMAAIAVSANMQA
jgi:lipopolysaccharide transport system ATP-binding protein